MYHDYWIQVWHLVSDLNCTKLIYLLTEYRYVKSEYDKDYGKGKFICLRSKIQYSDRNLLERISYSNSWNPSSRSGHLVYFLWTFGLFIVLMCIFRGGFLRGRIINGVRILFQKVPSWEKLAGKVCRLVRLLVEDFREIPANSTNIFQKYTFTIFNSLFPYQKVIKMFIFSHSKKIKNISKRSEI